MKTSDQMFEMVAQWINSSQPKGEFLKDKTITEHKFNYWLRKYRDSKSAPQSDIGAFKEIEIPPVAKSKTSRTIEVSTPSGYVITIVEEC